MSKDESGMTPRDELLRDRRHEAWLLVKGLATALAVLVFVVIRHRYLL